MDQVLGLGLSLDSGSWLDHSKHPCFAGRIFVGKINSQDKNNLKIKLKVKSNIKNKIGAITKKVNCECGALLWWS
ncbi:MAG: hypothetical protein QXO76_10590 [Thermoproteota archaeon]